ncbi:MAG: tetratricopeptide repeat protein [Bacteroidetes bacterium]|nr:tetratricopeptide repeat protein [Bacteroidota bacterium]MBS1930646.1 tetratricopeptide repeat protein [Bacteroidota bacterium]
MDRIKKLKEFLRDNPSDSFLQHALALEYIKLGEDVKAKELFESVLQKDPGYIGSYYHLAKLMERAGETDAAVKVCEKGMEEAKKSGEQLAYNELRSLFEDMTF